MAFLVTSSRVSFDCQQNLCILFLFPLHSQGFQLTFKVDAWANQCRQHSLLSFTRGVSENQSRVASGDCERQISDK